MTAAVAASPDADSGDAVKDGGETEVMDTVSPFGVAKGARVAQKGERTCGMAVAKPWMWQ